MGTHRLKVMFLGGLGEVGKNMVVLEYRHDIIVIDAGIGFPEEDMFGVDVLIPDISYLREHADRVRAIFITHGHEDHIGAIPYLFDELRVPIYSTRLTQGLLQARLKERKLLDRADLRLFHPDDDPRIIIGNFTVECFRVSHSIPDAVGFAVTTPAGMVVHTGDFKFDQTPVAGRLADMAKLGEIGRRKPLVLISDCVHVESPGVTPSERVVGETFDALFERAPGRILVTTFASAISRVQQILTVAHRHGRKVACVGRSLQNNVRVALDLGYLKPPEGTLVRLPEASKLPPSEVTYVCTGSQGEPLAALSRIAHRDHREIQIQPGDTVIISATPIPGNETSVFRVINQLFHQGADVIYSARALVHVSGHASQDELRLMLNLVQPRFVIPFHGEPRHLQLYAMLARDVGIPGENILIGELGTVFEFDRDGTVTTGEVPSGTVYIGGGSAGKIGDITIRDRQALARDGILMVAATLDRQSGRFLAGPEIVARGFGSAGENRDLLSATADHLQQLITLNGNGESAPVNRKIREATQEYIFTATRRRPMIIPMVMEV
ncbi:MAG TPA: ribonuclease J [Nitrolancea sp.]|nr:ribonuclease J [Nitrolancea sp.]